jgi:thiosulfate/3-mercaptopyruvate sulfurtransferase
MMSSTANNPSAKEDDLINSPFPRLYGNTLVSVQTIASLNFEQQQQDAVLGSKSSSKVVFIDGSWYHRSDPITNLPRNPTQDFISGPRLPAARYLDIDALATTYELFPDDNPMKLPHMMPPPALFRLAMDAYNIRNEDHVVIYARRGALFTPRVWFLFHSMGHDDKRLHLMQGSLEDYVDVGGIVETGEYHHSSTVIENQYIECFNRGILNATRLYQEYSTTTIRPHYNVGVPRAMNVCDKDVVLAALSNNGDVEKKNTLIIDTRGSGYAKNGHMPTAIHLPYTQISNSTNALVIQPVSKLKKLFEDRQIDYLDPALKIILSCGSGV